MKKHTIADRLTERVSVRKSKRAKSHTRSYPQDSFSKKVANISKLKNKK